MASELESDRRKLSSPLGLLALGYGTAGLAALAVGLMGGGFAAVLLIFWLGGALGTLVWAAARASLAAADRAGEKRTGRSASHASPNSVR